MSLGILHLIISEIQVEYFRNNETTVTFHINEVPEALINDLNKPMWEKA